MAETETWTIGRLLTWTTGYLKEHGSESPRLDAEVLLAQARGCQRIDLYTAFDEEPDERCRTAFRELVRRRAEGTPVAYLVGRREFYSMDFRVSPAVLIPRPSTEFVVVALLDLAKGREGEPLEIADVGTGSGVLAVCAAKHLPAARVLAIDVSAEALEVARANAQDHGVADRVEFAQSDLFADVPAGRRFDFILSNPPYVRSAEMDELPRDVREHEPHLALDAGPRGMDVIERLIAQSAERLRPGGWLLCEISPMIERDVAACLQATGGWEPPAWIKDLEGHTRIVQVQRSAETSKPEA